MYFWRTREQNIPKNDSQEKLSKLITAGEPASGARDTKINTLYCFREVVCQFTALGTEQQCVGYVSQGKQ